VWSGEATVLLLVLCSTWTLLPLFLHDEKPLTAYFFLGLNILQGLLVFLFYCLNAGKVQNSDEPPGPDWLCSCLREPPRRRSLYSPPGSCPHNVSNPLSNPHINNPSQTLYPVPGTELEFPGSRRSPYPSMCHVRVVGNGMHRYSHSDNHLESNIREINGGKHDGKIILMSSSN
ncbi:adhesion G protein-coupled receptor L1, partial [Nephila pilipes]